MPNFLKKLRNRFKKKNKFCALPTTPTFRSYLPQEADFDVSFTSPIESQDPIYDTPSSIYSIPYNFQEQVRDGLSNTNDLFSLKKCSLEPIYSTIKKTTDTGSQTDLMFPPSLLSLIPYSSLPPPPPPLPPLLKSTDPLEAIKKAKKIGNGNIKLPVDQRDQLFLELNGVLKKRRNLIDGKA